MSEKDKSPDTPRKETSPRDAVRRYKYKGPRYIVGAQKLLAPHGRKLDPIIMTDDQIDALAKDHPALVASWWETA